MKGRNEPSWVEQGCGEDGRSSEPRRERGACCRGRRRDSPRGQALSNPNQLPCARALQRPLPRPPARPPAHLKGSAAAGSGGGRVQQPLRLEHAQVHHAGANARRGEPSAARRRGEGGGGSRMRDARELGRAAVSGGARGAEHAAAARTAPPPRFRHGSPAGLTGGAPHGIAMASRQPPARGVALRGVAPRGAAPARNSSPLAAGGAGRTCRLSCGTRQRARSPGRSRCCSARCPTPRGPLRRSAAGGAPRSAPVARVDAGHARRYVRPAQHSTTARQQKMRSDGNYFPSGRKVLT